MKRIYYILLITIILIFSSCMSFDFNTIFQTKVKVTLINDIYYNTGEEVNINLFIYKDNEKIQEIKNLKSGKYKEIELNSGIYKFIIDYNEKKYEKNYEVKSNITIKISEIMK
ncbi:hypothetical protein X275_04100 [Marinitoga sp. 1197]|uniref:hypothetical protein n=1 Tax=Marinitoga sp. 1197 TaxID=1428449 RepID=UPI0006411A12|nr:hypothetical protein [Marinitoga sp. 1197]KLO23048.1 hypothetical protein X275_04100 [Marinitoga sp. 1197]